MASLHEGNKGDWIEYEDDAISTLPIEKETPHRPK